MSIFTVLTAVLLYFFTFASRSTRKHENLSKKYREMIAVMDKIETLVAGSKILYVDARQVSFARFDQDRPILAGGMPNFQPIALTLFSYPADANSGSRLGLVEKGKSNTIVNLKGDTVNFRGTIKPDTRGIAHYQSPLVVTYSGKYVPEEGIGTVRDFHFTRAISFDEF